MALGGAGSDLANAVAVGKDGSIYVAGSFEQTLALGSMPTSKGESDVFVAKLDRTGKLLWLATGGGVGADLVDGLALDSMDGPVVVGRIGASATFGATTVPFGTTSGEAADIFVAKYDTAGTLSFAKSFGGSTYQSSSGVHLDANGTIYLAGQFNAGGAFSIGKSTFTSNGGADAFVATLDSNGAPGNANRFGDVGQEGVDAFGLDAVGNLYIAMEMYSEPATILGVSNNASAFNEVVAALDPKTLGPTWTPNAVLYGDKTHYQGGGPQGCVAVAPAGYFYLCGVHNPGTNDDMWLAEVNSANGGLNGQTFPGGNGDDISGAVALDPSGDAIFVGYFDSISVANGLNNANGNMGTYDIYVARYTKDSLGVLWQDVFGSLADDTANGVAVDQKSSNVVVVGKFGGPMTIADEAITPVGGADGFVASFGSLPP